MGSDSESEGQEDVLRPVFPLPPPPDHPLKGPPTTAEQYLQQVRQESAQLPDVFIAPRRTRFVPALSLLSKRLRLPSTPCHLLPAPEWEEDTLREFVSLQEKVRCVEGDGVVADIPKRGNEAFWRQCLFEKSDKRPSMTFVAALGEIRVMDALCAVDNELHTHGYEQGDSAVENAVAEKVAVCAEWVYALLVGLEMPLCAESAATIRSLLRKMVIARRALSGDEQALAKVNVLITIMEKHFEQGDVS